MHLFQRYFSCKIRVTLLLNPRPPLLDSISALLTLQSYSIFAVASSVISIGSFAGCSQLKEISLVHPVKHVAPGAFTNCISLKNIVVGTEDKEIGAGTFYGCESLEQIVIPEGIVSIEASAFADCVYLTSVTLPSTLENIASQAFAGCQKLPRISLPEALDMIGVGAFSGCSKLTKIDIPDNVVDIGRNAFSGTNWLKAQSDETFVVAGDGVLVQYNGNAENIVIPETVKRIPAYRFASLSTEPKSFTLPSSVQYISADAFSKRVDKSDSYYYEKRYVTIIGREGTYAETFANHEYYTFEAIK